MRLCDLAEDFFDGELPEPQADEYRAHAATCDTCRGELLRLSQLRALEVQYRPRLEARLRAEAADARARSAAWAPWKWAFGGAFTAFATVLLAWVLWFRVDERDLERSFYPEGQRLTAGRSSYRLARSYHPLAPVPLGPEDVRPGDDGALLELKRGGDLLGQAALRLASGTPDGAKAAFGILKDEPPTADVLSERAFAQLVAGGGAPSSEQAEQALQLADQALELDADHAPAQWNRALALEAMGLQALAANAFDAIAAHPEPGWSDEARERARKLHEVIASIRDAWNAADAAGKELVATGALPPHEVLGVSVLRHYVYDAVLSGASLSEVNQLRPLAHELDARAGNHALERYVDWVSRQDFGVRGPLSAEYKRLAVNDPSVDGPALIARLRQAHANDLLIGALNKLDHLKPDPALLKQLPLSVDDPWLRTQALSLLAGALKDEHHLDEARDALQQELQLCRQAGIYYRCAQAEMRLADLYLKNLSDYLQATLHARQGLEDARWAGAWAQQGQLILELAQLARLADDYSMARALYGEDLAREGGVQREREGYAHEGLASLEVKAVRVDEARRHIDAALATGLPLQLPGALALADIARVRPDPARDEPAMGRFRSGLDRLVDPGEKALATHALGRWEIERDRQRGEALLRGAMRLATQDGLARKDLNALKALTYSYTSLIFDAGKRGEVDAALRLFEEEWRAGSMGTLPERCLLAITYDAPERLLAIARGPTGGPPVASYDANLTKPLSYLTRLVPSPVRAALAGCQKVDVVARPPLYGRKGLLPPDMAWSYKSGPEKPDSEQDQAPGRHLVIQQASTSAATGLPLPAQWPVKSVGSELSEQISRNDATPSKVLRRMEDATDVTFVAHGIVRKETNEAYLALAPDIDGNGDLRASDIQKIQLRRHPVVILVSCEAAQPGPALYEARSLPAAFIKAGARAVLAASDPVSDRDGPRFFEAVRARIRAGTPPAEALRAERETWMSNGFKEPWLTGVLLFE